MKQGTFKELLYLSRNEIAIPTECGANIELEYNMMKMRRIHDVGFKIRTFRRNQILMRRIRDSENQR